MDKELTNRERRLRYKAEKKGLIVRKGHNTINGCKYPGYLICLNTGFVVTGYNHFNNLIPIEEAEEFINEY